MIKAIIFDTDGMIITTDPFSVQYSREFGISYEKILPFFKTEFQLCLVGKADLREILKPHLKEWGWSKSVDELLEYWFKSESHIDQCLVEIIKELRQRGIECYLATNQEKYRTQYMREKMGFNTIFNRIFSSAQVGFKKPTVEFFDYVVKQLPEINKEEILFWDDKEENVTAARNYGLEARQYVNFENFKAEIERLIFS